MRKTYSPGKPSELKIISILKNNKDLKHGTSLSKYISSKTTNRNTNTKYNLKERPASHKTINSLMSKKTKPLIQKQQNQYQYQHQPINVKNNKNEINIHLSFGSDSINNNTNSYLNNTNYSKVTNSYEDILKEKDLVILKLENELLFNRELINKMQSNYNIYNSNYTNNNNNFISLSKTKSSGNITTKRKTKHDTEYFFSSLLKNISKKSKKKKMSYGGINTNNIDNINGVNHMNNRLTNIIYSSTNKDNIIKGNYNNYYNNLNLNLKNKKKKKKTNSCEMIDKIKCIENLLSPHKKANKDKNKNKEKEKDKKIDDISFDNWKFLCDNIYNRTKNALEKCKELLNIKLINNKDLSLNN